MSGQDSIGLLKVRAVPLMHRTVWLAVGLHMLLVFGTAAIIQPVNAPGTPYTSKAVGEVPYPFERMVRWDAQWYGDIANDGYDKQSAAFFPSLPLSMRLLSLNGRLSVYAIGLLICNLCMVAVFYLVAQLGVLQFGEKVAKRAVFAVALMPTSLFFNSVYSEPMFLMFVLASLLFAKKERWWLAGLVGALAAGTRNLGLAMAGILMIEALFMYRKPCRAMLAGLLVPLGLLGFMSYHAVVLRDPLAFLHAQEYWGRSFQWPWDGLYGGVHHLLQSVRLGNTTNIGRDAQNLFLTTIWIGLLVWASVYRKAKVPISWQVLSWLLLITPLVSGLSYEPLYSMARFSLVVPVAYYMAARLPKPLYLMCLVFGGLALIFNTIQFTSWKFIG